MTTTLRGRAAAAARSAARDDPRTDAELLARFVDTREQPAFTALVHRHGPLVLGVCRWALGATADADDAFQAAFLVLIRKAESIPWRANLGPWLFGVAFRIARKARFKRDRRFAVEKQVDAMPHPAATAPDAAESDELSRAFDDELAALPEAMRRAVVLCELQGVGRAAAAKQLGISEGTLSSRLARARKALKDRLARRGFTLVMPVTAVVSAKLAAATVGLANGAVGVVPAAVWALSQEAMKMMAISKLRLGAVLVAAVIGLTGFGLSASGNGDDKPVAKAKADPPAAADAKPPTQPVATVNGQDISRAEFGEYLIRKHGAKEIEGYVNKKIIDAEAAKRGVAVAEKELDSQFFKESMFMFMLGSEDATKYLAQQGRSFDTVRQYEILPRMLLRKLCEPTVTVTDEDIRRAFDNKFGEKRMVDIVGIANAHETDLSDMVRQLIRQGTTDFDAIQAKVSGLTRRQNGRAEVRRYPISIPAHVEMIEEVFRLERVGKVVETKDVFGRVTFFKLLEVVPAEAGKKIEEERAGLREYVLEAKLEMAIPKLAEKLRGEAKPVYNLPYVLK